MLIYDDFSKKCLVILKIVFIAFLKVFKLECVPSFKSMNSSFLSRRKYDGDHFTTILCKWLKGQNTSVEIELIELTEPSATLNYKSIIKNCFSRTILHVFLLFIFVWNKILCPKNWAVFYLLLLLLLLLLSSFLLLLLLFI